MIDDHRGARAPAGLYVHVPFCRTRCQYCDFYSETGEPTAGYVAGVLREAELCGDGYPPFDTLYLGGGTPSVLAPDELIRLLQGLRSRLAIAPDAEVTVELNPDDVNDVWVEALKSVGVQRVSLGVQSFSDDALEWLGRRHDVSRARAAIDRVANADFAALSLDLIFGWPGQDRDVWRRDLEQALAYEPDHLSAYQLTVESGTPLHGRVLAGETRLMDEDALCGLYVAGARFLRDQGWEHYEVSNYALTAAHRSKHNAKYWRHVDYLGLGPAAHSLRGRERWWNPRSVSEWLSALQKDRAPRAGGEILDARSWRLETVMLGLRTADGVRRDVFDDVPGADDVIEDLMREGRIRVLDGKLKPTLKGMLVADGLPLRFDL